jgi:hypothetical protein
MAKRPRTSKPKKPTAEGFQQDERLHHAPQPKPDSEQQELHQELHQEQPERCPRIGVCLRYGTADCFPDNGPCGQFIRQQLSPPPRRREPVIRVNTQAGIGLPLSGVEILNLLDEARQSREMSEPPKSPLIPERLYFRRT